MHVRLQTSYAEACFSIFKKGQGRTFTFPQVAWLWVWLNMHQHLWISLNILEKTILTMSGLWNSSSSYMFNRLLKMPQILNVPGFWIWYGCVSKGYTEFWICLNMAQYASIMPECLNMLQCPSICTNMAEYCWMSLNMPGNFWINCSDYVRVLNMPHHIRCLTKFLMCHRH